MVQDIIKNRNKKLNVKYFFLMISKIYIYIKYLYINESELIKNEYFGEEAKDKGLVDHIGSY